MPMIAVLMPTTSPDEVTSGPPELPGLSAASVWITLSISRPERVRNERPSALTTPAVTVHWKPKGLPIATTSWPTRNCRESPSRANAEASPSRRSTARSVSGSSPTRVAPRLRPSGNAASILRASLTTWLLVRTYASGVKTTPEPAPPPPLAPVTCRCRTAGPTLSTAPITARE